MKILRTTEEALLQAAEECGFIVSLEYLNPSRNGGSTFNVSLRPGPDTVQRTANPLTGRRINAVCWHGFRDFYRALFSLTPNAGIRSMLASWDGVEDFESSYRQTGHRQVGPRIYPYSIVDKCDPNTCPEAGYAW